MFGRRPKAIRELRVSKQLKSVGEVDVSYNAAKNLGCQQRLDILSREKQRRPSVDQHQTSNHCPAVTEFLRYVTVDEQPNEFADIGTLLRNPTD